MIKNLFIILLISVSCFSCKLFTAASEMKNFLDEDIILPPSAEYFHKGQDTTSVIFDSKKAKLVVYYPSNACNICEIKNAYLWSEFIQHTKWTRDKFSLYFFYSPKSEEYEEIKRSVVAMKDMIAPMIIDPKGEFEQLNKTLPNIRKYQTFLLDQNNKVVLVGNPLGNEKMWELYKKEIARLCNE